MNDGIVLFVSLFASGLFAGILWQWRLSALLAAALAFGLLVALIQFDDWSSARNDVGSFVEFWMLCGMLLFYFGFWYVPSVVGALSGAGLRTIWRKRHRC